LPEEMRQQLEDSIAEQKKAIEEIENPKERAAAWEKFEEGQRKLMLGIALQDEQVAYNPSPLTLFGNVFQEMRRTFVALFTGYLSPKWMAGPVGIVGVMQHSWSLGAKEALF